MTQSRQLLTVALLVLVFLAGGGALGYFLFVQPIAAKNQAADRLAVEVQDQEAKLSALRKNLSRLADAKKRSLPAEELVASREYHDVLFQLLQDAKVPAGSTVRVRQVDNKSVPQLAAKKPAYTRVAYEINFSKGDLWSLVDFLHSYYKLNLLQQITSISVKKADDTAATSASRRVTAPDAADRKDLNVTLVTEALILDGAESRRSVLSVPTAFAMIGGWAGHRAVTMAPEVGRRITPQQFTPVLATRPRDYTVMIARDPFHGTLPPPPPKYVPPPPVEEEEPLPLPPPKPDIAQHIRLVGITMRGDGTAAFEVRDLMNNTQYEVHFSSKGVEVKKYVGTASRRQEDKSPKAANAFVISDNGESSTARNYKVIGVESDALFLLDSKDSLPPLDGLSGLAGGAITAAPPAKLLRWRLGQSLKEVIKASPDEMLRVLEDRNDTGSGTVAQAR